MAALRLGHFYSLALLGYKKSFYIINGLIAFAVGADFFNIL